MYRCVEFEGGSILGYSERKRGPESPLCVSNATTEPLSCFKYPKISFFRRFSRPCFPTPPSHSQCPSQQLRHTLCHWLEKAHLHM